MRNERGLDNISLSERARDRDIHALSVVNSMIGGSGMHFVLTGSYAVEALTGNRLRHDDMDANIFTTDLAQDLEKAAILFKDLRMPGGRFSLYKRTVNRLEYDLQPTLEAIAPGRLEIQFVEIVGVSDDQAIGLILKSEEKEPPRVPTTLVSLKDSNGGEFIFRVKSLPFAIATWAIRISGSAHSPERPVRDSDLEQFRLLLARGYNFDNVALAMKYHPQMPKNITEKQIFQQALTILGR